MNIQLKAQIPFYTMPEALLKIGCALLVCVETLPHVILKRDQDILKFANTM